MAFKEVAGPKRHLMLHPLMDMFFIMMLFFLIIAANRKPDTDKFPVEPYKFVVPEIEDGKANLLLQLTNDNQIYWLDFDYNINTGNLSELAPNELNQLLIPSGQLERKFTEFANRLRSDGRGEINIAVRGPIDLAYEKIEEIRKKLTGISKNLNCVTVRFAMLVGDINDIRISEIDSQRRAIQIDFEI